MPFTALVHSDEGFTLSGLEGEQVSFKSRFRDSNSEGSLKPATIRDCVGCHILVDCPVSLLNIYNARDTTVVASGVKGSIHLFRCESTSVSGFSRQLRISDSYDIEVHVQTSSSTALANSVSVRIGAPPSSDSIPGCQEALSTLSMSSEEYTSSNSWMNVKDFNCLVPDSPNWSFL